MLVVTSHNTFQKETDLIITNIIADQVRLLQNIHNYTNQSNDKYIARNHFTFVRKSSFEIRKILLFLRNNQNYVYNLLINVKDKDKQIQIAKLFANSFYSNYFSSESIEEEYLIVLSRTLKHEINNLNDSNNPSEFMSDNSINSHLLDHLINKMDVKTFFIKILKKFVKSIDYNEDKRTITFDIKTMNEKMIEEKQKLNKNGEKENSKINASVINLDLNKAMDLQQSFFDDNFYSNNKNINQHKLTKSTFYNKYVPDLTTKTLMDIMENSNTSDTMKEYLSKQLAVMEKDKNYFSNSQFISLLYSSTSPAEILNKCYSNFANTIELLDDILNQMYFFMEMVPPSIRYIAKIILSCLQQKFPDITTVDCNAFLSRFFFEKLLGPILLHLDVNGLSNIISHSTQNTISILTKIIRQMLYAVFFNVTDDPTLTIFNWYFIDKMPFIINFFNKLTDIELPSIIKKMVIDNDNNNDNNNDNIIDEDNIVLQEFNPDKYVFDYFKENPNENMCNISICYTPTQLKIIIETILQNEEVFLKNEGNNPKIKEFIIGVKNISMDSLKELISKDKESLSESYVYLHERIYNNNISVINDYNNSAFTIKENSKNQTKNNTIKTKNCLCAILTSFADIPKNTFFGREITNFDSFLNALALCKKLQFNKISDKADTFWNIQRLDVFISKLEKYYKNNDYYNLLNELINEVDKALKGINVNIITYMKILKENCDIMYREQMKMVKRVDQIQINQKILSFIENTSIPIQIIVFDKKEINFKFKAKNHINKHAQVETKTSLFGNKITEKFNCQNINDFIKFFPDLNNFTNNVTIKPSKQQKEVTIKNSIFSLGFFEKNTLNVFLIADHFKIPKVISDYLDNLENTLKQDNNIIINSEIDNQELLTDTSLIISTYILDKLYNKLFPKEQIIDDKTFQLQCKRFSYMEFVDYPGGTNINMSSLIPTAIQLFEHLEESRNPYSKMQILSKISDHVHKQLSLSIQDYEFDTFLAGLSFIIIQSQMSQLPSNIYFIKLFLINASSNKVISDFESAIFWIRNLEEDKEMNIFDINIKDELSEVNNEEASLRSGESVKEE